MQSNELHGNAPHSTEMQGNSVENNATRSTLLQLDADRIPIGDKTEYHTKTIKEAEQLFKQAGVAVSVTTVWRMCQKDKNGLSILDAVKDPSLKVILITEQSIAKAIEEERYKRTKRKTETTAGEPHVVTPQSGGRGDSADPDGDLKRKYERLQEDYHELDKENARNKGMLSMYERHMNNIEKVTSTIVKTVLSEIERGNRMLKQPEQQQKIAGDTDEQVSIDNNL